jgi:hypothetical protein
MMRLYPSRSIVILVALQPMIRPFLNRGRFRNLATLPLWAVVNLDLFEITSFR